jgi:hypothetical protein
LHIKGDDLLLVGMMRENTNNLVGASMCVGGVEGRGGVWVILLQQSCFSSLKRKKQHKKTQEVTIKLDLSYHHVPKMSIVSM